MMIFEYFKAKNEIDFDKKALFRPFLLKTFIKKESKTTNEKDQKPPKRPNYFFFDDFLV